MGIYASDLESTGLLNQMAVQKNPKLHNLCSIAIDSDEVVLIEGSRRKDVQNWLNQGHTFIMHNCYTYDMPALEFLGYDVSKTKFIDSLALSWYLDPQRIQHGLAAYGEEFGVKKPKIENWEEQTQEEYNHRVLEDCRIQKRLWQKQVGRLQELYGKEPGSFDRLVKYLMWKMQCLRMQQDNKVKLDEPAALKLQGELLVKIDDKTQALRKVMPEVAVYAIRNRPQKAFKKSGELSSGGEKWKELTDSLGLSFEHIEPIKVVIEMKEGNPASHVQMKAWMDSLGWVAETFKFIREDNGETRQIPQINLKGGEICQSVKDLIPKCAGIEHIAGLGILNHRYSVVTGFLREAFQGELVASSQGFTNTIRMQHRIPLCNLPSTRVPYGEEIRSLLVAKEGEVFLGSDLSGVENYVKNHYQFRIDPEYVKTQLAPGFDPHLLMATAAGLMSLEDSDWYKYYKKLNKSLHTKSDDDRYSALDLIRAVGKTASYSLQYGAGVKTVARSCKVSEKVAKKLHKAYNDLNWSVAKIASMMVTKKTSFGEWQINPINKFWYSLRSEKDRFSTLVQGSSAYIFDIWLYQCLLLAKEREIPYKLLCQMHDDQLTSLPIGDEVIHEALVRDALKKVNDSLKLNVEIKCDVMFGNNAAEVH
jgi:DNA polymerase I-like protein with 3'-5' exonuclease and polymerase domains